MAPPPTQGFQKKPDGKVPVTHERRLARGGRIGEQTVLGLEHAERALAPGVVRAHEVVRGEDAAGREEGCEEDEVEDEEGRGTQPRRLQGAARPTKTRK